MSKIKIAPSIICADLANLQHELSLMESAGIEMVHIDVMDGNFVPNITLGAKLIKDMRKYSNLIFDVHLMINNPEKYIESFANAGSNNITIHVEATDNITATLKLIKSFNINAGIAIKPNTTVEDIQHLLLNKYLNQILIMTVEPGFAGQQFLYSQWDKIKALSEIRTEDIKIGIDGGVNKENLAILKNYNISFAVMGNALYKNHDFIKNYRELNAL